MEVCQRLFRPITHPIVACLLLQRYVIPVLAVQVKLYACGPIALTAVSGMLAGTCHTLKYIAVEQEPRNTTTRKGKKWTALLLHLATHLVA